MSARCQNGDEDTYGKLKNNKDMTNMIRINRWANRATILIGLCACLTLLGCNSKPDAVRELMELRTEIKEHSAEYTPQDWEAAIKKFSEICKKVDETPLTDEERLEADRIKGEIAGYAASVAAQEVASGLQSITEEIGAFAEGFNNAFQVPDNLK